MKDQDSTVKNEHLIPYKIFVFVWLALIILTLITAGASTYFPGAFGIAVAIIITPIKAFLVLEIFMHLRYESKAFRYMFLVTIGIVAVFMALTLVDYTFR